ncbi:uncharacterized protein DCTN3-p24 [Venturia canescens]|uniref:uncharacterized protein DCTN3-p24 n=1 Tax=Venturia canescens TaxID=32260 RepID=UPI001C9BD6A4|nr:uncharacterized protein LOC122409589 [Venturia canescens]XP_043273208.1 uncharacterized protein LOC122409589 [Venturia canescens]
MASINLLEERVTELESRVYGLNKKISIDDTLPEKSVVDNLLHANTLISSALSGRENTNVLVKRLPELSDMLDPSYDSEDLQNDAKLELLLAMEPEIKEHAESIKRLEELAPALKLDHMRDTPELMPKLNKITLSYIESHKQSEQLAGDVWALFTEYNNIIESIAKTLISLNTVVTAAEAAATPKKQLD